MRDGVGLEMGGYTEGERGWRVKFACRWVQKNQTSEK